MARAARATARRAGKPVAEPALDIASLDVSLADVAALLSCSKVRISQHCHEGTLPKPVDGRYPLLASMQAYVAHLKAQRANAPSAEKKALVAAQVDLTRARTEEHKRKALGKEYILVSDARALAKRAYANEAANYREQALGFPYRMAERCEGLAREPMALILREEQYAMLNAFADGLDRSADAIFEEETNPVF